MQFLLRTPPEPFRRTNAWTTNDHGSYAWEVRLENPRLSDGEFTQKVSNFKSGLLQDDEQPETWAPDGRARYYTGEMLFTRYLEKLDAKTPRETDHARTWVMLPAIRDEAKRSRYVSAIRKAMPGLLPDGTPRLGLLSEPEMVLEYFRPVQNTLHIEPDRNNLFLVIDIGAATCNLTFAQSTQDGKVTAAEVGDQRQQRLRPVYSDSRQYAGRWVDEELARILKVVLPSHRKERNEVLDQIERIKIDVALKQRSRGVRGAERHLEVDDLEATAVKLWENLSGLYDRAAQEQRESDRDRVWAQPEPGRP